MAINAFVIRLDAGTDKAGNPMRVYVVSCNERGVVAAIDEGYEGKKALTNDPDEAAIMNLFPTMGFGTFAYTPNPLADVVTFQTTVSEYRKLLKEYGPGSEGRKKS